MICGYLHSHTYQHIKHAFGMVVMLYHTYLMIVKSKLPPWEQPRLILHVSAHRYSVCVLLLAPLQQMIADTVLYMVGTVSKHLGYRANQYELLIILQITAVSWQKYAGPLK